MDTITAQLKIIQEKIKTAERQHQRATGSVKLLLVSKGQAIEKIQQAIAAGQQCFGENYLQEALQKIAALQSYNLEWHFIGSIQTNKTKKIAENFQWVQSVCRLKIAERLSEQRPITMAPLNVCLQVKIDDEPQKEGVSLQELPELAFQVAKLPRLQLRGLMVIPEPTTTPELQKKPFQILHQAFSQLQQAGLKLDTLSMGMSSDFETAIAAGATLIRIGTAVFGSR